MNNRVLRWLPFLSFMAGVAAGLIVGLIWKNMKAGLVAGIGLGLIAMPLMRFILPRSKPAPPPQDEEGV